MWQQYAIFIGAGSIGAIAHYIKKFYIDEHTTESLFSWFGTTTNIKATMTMYGTFVIASITALNSGIIIETTPIIAVIYTGLLTGFSSDSFNKSESLPPRD